MWHEAYSAYILLRVTIKITRSLWFLSDKSQLQIWERKLSPHLRDFLPFQCCEVTLILWTLNNHFSFNILDTCPFFQVPLRTCPYVFKSVLNCPCPFNCLVQCLSQLHFSLCPSQCLPHFPYPALFCSSRPFFLLPSSSLPVYLFNHL